MVTMTMNDIIAFIERAMKENLNINTTISERPTGKCEYVIRIWNFNEDNLVIRYDSCYNAGICMKILVGHFDSIKIEASEMDVALFKVEALKAQEYSKNKAIEAFNNFFENTKNKITDINDLDD